MFFTNEITHVKTNYHLYT